MIEDDDVTLADSNAIRVYLAMRYTATSSPWLPRDLLGAAQVQRWLSVVAGPLASGPGAARLIQLFKSPSAPDEAVARAHALFVLMAQQLAASDFPVGPLPSLADVANYSHTACARGLVSLVGYPPLRAWLARIEALPGFVPMLKNAGGADTLFIATASPVVTTAPQVKALTCRIGAASQVLFGWMAMTP